ncbi:MAG: DUF4316 domain-containing protein [Bacteroidaceae bacterium]|nr:DUF4316 domain-containing protein [Bacteroidaceae bacterium]
MAEEMKGNPIEKWSDVTGQVAEKEHVMGDVSKDADGRSIGERFRDLRESIGMNRKDFAEYLDIPYRTMQDWERNVSTMPTYVYALVEYKVAHEFGITPESSKVKDPNALGEPRRSLEDQIEQNDNQLDGIINNLPEETVAEKESRASVVEKLREKIKDVHDMDERRPKVHCCDRELC